MYKYTMGLHPFTQPQDDSMQSTRSQPQGNPYAESEAFSDRPGATNPEHGLYLAPDDPTQCWSFVSYGSSQTVSNSQCGVSGVGTNISGSGNSLTLSLSLTFTPAYTGAKNVYTDLNASNPNYIAVTTYTVQ
jgi:hypothetical protein